MQIFIVHDTAGNIVSAAASADPGGQAVLIQADPHLVTSVDVSGIQLPSTGAAAGKPPDFVELAAHLAAHHRIEHGKLVARS
jgi:hypothetical protein